MGPPGTERKDGTYGTPGIDSRLSASPSTPSQPAPARGRIPIARGQAAAARPRVRSTRTTIRAPGRAGIQCWTPLTIRTLPRTSCLAVRSCGRDFTQKGARLAEAPPPKNLFASWRTSRLCVRSTANPFTSGIDPSPHTAIGARPNLDSFIRGYLRSNCGRVTYLPNQGGRSPPPCRTGCGPAPTRVPWRLGRPHAVQRAGVPTGRLSRWEAIFSASISNPLQHPVDAGPDGFRRSAGPATGSGRQ